MLTQIILSSLISYTLAQIEAPATDAPITGPPVTMPPITAPPVDTTPSASPSDHSLIADFRCGTDANDSRDNCGNICQFPTDCAPGLFCFASWNTCYVQDQDQTVLKAPASPLPTQLQPMSDFRCGVTEADARSNCKSECTVSTDCETGESCWATHDSYCHIMPEGHPQCDYPEAENIVLRCGYDEMASRGFCGAPCENEVDCEVRDEKCYPVHLNLCECFEQQDLVDEATPYRNLGRRHLDQMLEVKERNSDYFIRAKEQIDPYFQNDDSDQSTNNNNDEPSGGLDAVGIKSPSSANKKNQTGGIVIMSGLFIILALFM